MQTTSSKSGCGCAGGGGNTSGGCGCAGGCGCKPARLPESAPAICSPCQTASFVRPRFFAGQLLTEDDLGALVDYVVTKNRFHNTRLFGDGVVCGLEVECGPCDGSQIIVQPGYALDCCGNDLVLTCEQTLDLVPMIRDLAAQRDGGCVDPCPPAAPASSPTTSSESQQDPPPNKHYCLYAKYAERPDQPVAAYPVGGDCDAASCEPTRIVEGIVFELRCPAACKPMTIFDAWKECVDRTDPKGEVTKLAVAFRSASLALGALDTKPSSEYSKDEIDTLGQGARELDTIIADAKGPERTVALARYLATVVGPYSRSQLSLGVTLPGDLDGKQGKQIEANAVLAVEELTSMERTGPYLELLAPLDAAIVQASIEAYQAVQAIITPKAAQNPADLKSPGIQAFLYGGTASRKMLQVGAGELDAVAVRLQQLTGCGKNKVHTACRLPDLIDKLRPTWGMKGDPADYIVAGRKLGEAADTIERLLLIECMCAHINPPCPPCDDTGVLLACFEVDRCKVVKICNTARCFVLAPTTLRYWGLFEPITNLLSKACCAEKPAHVPDVPPVPSKDPLEQAADRPRVSMLDTASYGRLTPAPVAFFSAPETQQNLAHLTALIAPANLRERLVPRLAIPNLATAHESEVADLRRELANLTNRLEKLEKPDKADNAVKAGRP